MASAGRGVVRLGPPGTAPRLTTNGGGPSPARTLPPTRPSHLHMIPSVEYHSPIPGTLSTRTSSWISGGNDRGTDRFSEEFVPLADGLYDEHLEELRKEGLFE